MEPQWPKGEICERDSNYVSYSHARHLPQSNIESMYTLCSITIQQTIHNTTQHNTTQHNTTQHNTTQHNTTQHNTTKQNKTQQEQNNLTEANDE